MSALTVTKNTALAAIITAVFMSAPAMASEGGKCRTDIAYNSVVPLDATPENFEILRKFYEAKDIRVERKGVAYTTEFDENRLRIGVGTDNKVSYYRCG